MKRKKVKDLVYEIVCKIPKGKVATYGTVANNIKQFKVNPRYVGYLLHNNPDPQKIPCHRVVDRNGKVAKNYKFASSASNCSLMRVRIEPGSRKVKLGGESWKKQKERLLNERVRFKNERCVGRNFIINLDSL